MGSSNSSQSDGASPRTPDGVVVYAIGDVHGRADLLRALLTGIECDAALRPHARPVLVFLGDYVDRGPDSKAVIERLALGAPATGPLAGAGWIALRGNHEDLLLAFLDQADKGRVWRANGGLDTLRSYLGDLPPLDSEALRLPFERALPKAHRRFLESLALTHREGDYLFVHAGLRPGIALTDQRPEDLMWIRDQTSVRK